MLGGLRSLCSCAALLCAGSLAAQSEPLTNEEISSATVLDSVSVPTPGEFFAAINKIERPAWNEALQPVTPATTTNRAKSALIVGTRVADGFIAVEAQDGQQVKNIGKDIIDLSKSLGVSESILARGNSIADFSENNDWSALREELDATEGEVKLQMAQQKDADLITLVTIGAWLRGLQTVSSIVSENYTPESAALLRQPAIGAYLVEKIDALPDRMKKDELIVKVRDGLATIQNSVSPNYPPIPDAVATLKETTTGLVDAISGEAPAQPAE